MGMTYSATGAGVEAKSRAIAALVKELKFRRTGLGAPAGLEGHFTGLVDFGENYLTLCTDGVGTKLLVAEALDRWDTVGIDCIAMNANDTICVGAEPLAFVDYIAVDRPRPEMVAAVGRGLSRGAELANLSIVGGETALLPEMVRGLDLSGTCLGFVKKGAEVTGASIRPGDALLGIESSGIHSNGLTLARKVFSSSGINLLDILPGQEASVGEELLRPTHMYVRPVLELLRKLDVHGLANITGGGLGNLVRLKRGVRLEISDPLEPQMIFKVLQKLGRISHREMYRTFNMGMGFCVILPRGQAGRAADLLAGHGLRSKVVGRVARGSGVVLKKHRLSFDEY